MALTTNFYNEIFEKEKYLNELIDKKLINIYYIKGKDGLKEFYISKRNDLEREYKISNNEIIGVFLKKINNIIEELDKIIDNVTKINETDYSKLKAMFIVNQLNNNIPIDKNNSMINKIIEGLNKTNNSDANQEWYDEDFFY